MCPCVSKTETSDNHWRKEHNETIDSKANGAVIFCVADRSNLYLWTMSGSFFASIILLSMIKELPIWIYMGVLIIIYFAITLILTPRRKWPDMLEQDSWRFLCWFSFIRLSYMHCICEWVIFSEEQRRSSAGSNRSLTCAFSVMKYLPFHYVINHLHYQK